MYLVSTKLIYTFWNTENKVYLFTMSCMVIALGILGSYDLYLESRTITAKITIIVSTVIIIYVVNNLTIEKTKEEKERIENIYKKKE